MRLTNTINTTPHLAIGFLRSAALWLMLFPVSLLQAQKIAQHDALTVEELQADLDVFLDVYDHHPGLHLYHTLEETDSVKAALQHLIQNGTSTEVFYTELLRALTFLGDGHTGISPGAVYGETFPGNRIIPFGFRILRDTVYISALKTGSYSECLFSRLLSVNGVDADSLLRHMYALTCADNQNHIFKQAFTERTFGRNLSYFFGATACYEMVCLSPAGDTIITQVNSVSKQDLPVSPSVPPLHSVIDSEHDLAILTINTFQYPLLVDAGTDFHSFLDKFFKMVRRKKIGHVVIDLRENYGGSSVLALSVFAYLSPEDFRYMDHSFTSLDGSESFARFTPYPDGHYPFFNTHDTTAAGNRLLVSNGEDSKEIFSANTIPFGPKKKLRDITANKYDRKLYVLTSGMTFSSASVLTAKCAERPNTTLIGEPTGSAAGVFCGGGFLYVTLPHSGFRVELPYMERHVALTDPDTDPHLPVMPDHWIDIHQADLMEGRDPVLEKVYELIH